MISFFCAIFPLSIHANILQRLEKIQAAEKIEKFESLIFQNPVENSKKPTLIYHTEIFNLRYANLDFVANLLNTPKMDLLSSQGGFLIDKNKQELWVKDEPIHLHQLALLLKIMNQPQPEVFIKAKIMSVDSEYLKNLGVLFNSRNNLSNKNRNNNRQESSSTNFDQINVPIIQFRDNSILNLQLSALNRTGHATVISRPELVTSNQKAATIESGDEVPYQEATLSGATSIAFKKAVLKLKVTPELKPNQHILLHIDIHQDRVGSLTVNGVPAIHTEQLQTEVLMQNKETLVLGGIEESNQSKQVDGVPGLQKIPLLGALFRKNQAMNNQKVLLIFITSKILNN